MPAWWRIAWHAGRVAHHQSPKITTEIASFSHKKRSRTLTSKNRNRPRPRSYRTMTTPLTVDKDFAQEDLPDFSGEGLSAPSGANAETSNYFSSLMAHRLNADDFPFSAAAVKMIDELFEKDQREQDKLDKQRRKASDALMQERLEASRRRFEAEMQQDQEKWSRRRAELDREQAAMRERYRHVWKKCDDMSIELQKLDETLAENRRNVEGTKQLAIETQERLRRTMQIIKETHATLDRVDAKLSH